MAYWENSIVLNMPSISLNALIDGTRVNATFTRSHYIMYKIIAERYYSVPSCVRLRM